MRCEKAMYAIVGTINLPCTPFVYWQDIQGHWHNTPWEMSLIVLLSQEKCLGKDELSMQLLSFATFLNSILLVHCSGS